MTRKQKRAAKAKVSRRKGGAKQPVTPFPSATYENYEQSLHMQDAEKLMRRRQRGDRPVYSYHCSPY